MRYHITSHYLLRNRNNITILFCRLEFTKLSFSPSTSSLWNYLDTTIKNQDIILKFKSELKKSWATEKVADYLLTGPRKYNIFATRIRNK